MQFVASKILCSVIWLLMTSHYFTLTATRLMCPALHCVVYATCRKYLALCQ